VAVLGLIAVEGFLLLVGSSFWVVSVALERRRFRARINAYSMKDQT
jgi:hypothetical protein